MTKGRSVLSGFLVTVARVPDTGADIQDVRENEFGRDDFLDRNSAHFRAASTATTWGEPGRRVPSWRGCAAPPVRGPASARPSPKRIRFAVPSGWSFPPLDPHFFESGRPATPQSDANAAQGDAAARRAAGGFAVVLDRGLRRR
jgi:hypothetical protein